MSTSDQRAIVPHGMPGTLVFLGDLLVIMGRPGDMPDEWSDAHNCDDMGCGSVGDHVLARSRLAQRERVPSLMEEALDRDGLRHVNARSDRELLVQAIRAAGHDGPRALRWSAVGAMLGHGSGVSYALCLAARLDPDEMVGIEPDEVTDADE